MKIVKLKGGLGNQMFQYAFAKYLSKKTGEEVRIDLTPFGKLDGDTVRMPRIQKFQITLPVATKDNIKKLCVLNHFGNSQSNLYRVGLILETLLNKKYCFERNHAFCSDEQMRKYAFFDGYWQDWNMVDEILPDLAQEFTPIQPISAKSLETLQRIKDCESVFVGIRRGDYLTVKPEHYGVFDQAYYDRAMKIVDGKVKDPTYFIFSNDIGWVQSNMHFGDHKVVYITETVDDFEDFILMTECRHSIIPNSTYHWWGARLHEYNGKVIVAPQKWFADDAPINILPDRWSKA